VTFADCEVTCASGTCPDGLQCGTEGLCRVAGAPGSCADVLADAGSDASDAATGPQPITLRQTLDDVIANGTDGCYDSNGAGDNRWFRAFVLGDHGIAGAFHASRVTFAVATVSDDMQVAVRIGSYTGPIGPGLDLSENVPLGTASVTVGPAMEGQLVDVALSATIPADTKLVVEISNPDFTNMDRFFVPGSTAAGDTQPVYWASVRCFQTGPTSTINGTRLRPLILEVTGTPE
jgi:hypothetical protein